MATRQLQTIDIQTTARARFFTRGRVETLPVTVTRDGHVLVYDDIAGHYTACHGLSDRAERRIASTPQRWDVRILISDIEHGHAELLAAPQDIAAEASRWARHGHWPAGACDATVEIRPQFDASGDWPDASVLIIRVGE